MAMSLSSACGGTPPSAALLPSYGSMCFGSARMPINYVAGACVESVPFVKHNQVDNSCCKDQTTISNCTQKPMIMGTGAPTAEFQSRSWSL